MPKKENPLRQLPVSSDGYGDIKIHLAEILEEKNISLNQLSFRTEMQRTQLRNYRDNKKGRTLVNALPCHVPAFKLYDIPHKVPDDILYPVIL